MQCKTAFVTGGGSGIGLALAETLARRGARVAAFDLRFSDEARARLRKVCPDARFFEVDVRDAAGVEAAVRQGRRTDRRTRRGHQLSRRAGGTSVPRDLERALRFRRRHQPQGQPELCRGGAASHAQRRAPRARGVDRRRRQQLRLLSLQLIQVRRRRARLGAAHRMQDAGHRGLRHLPARSRDADGGGGAPDGARHHDADQAVCRDGLAGRSLYAGRARPRAGPVHDRARQLARAVHRVPRAHLPEADGAYHGQHDCEG